MKQYPMNLSQYPAAISQMAQAVNSLNHLVRSQKSHIAKLEGNAEIVIAFNVNLRTKQQQGASRIALLQATDHGESIDRLNRTITDHANALATLEQLRNEFAVLKIQIWKKRNP
jgi:hypothetical protein